MGHLAVRGEPYSTNFQLIGSPISVYGVQISSYGVNHMILGLKSLPAYAQPDELLRRQHQVQAFPPHLDGVIQRLLRG
jgi:hypothetical protein